MIARRVADSGAVRVQDLSDELRVSVETIRRDLMFLERDGVLDRVSGGAATPGQRCADEPCFSERLKAQEQAKIRIGLAAAALVHDGAIIFLDVGTTTLRVASALPKTFHGLVVTNSVPVAVEFARRPSVQVLLTGGRMRCDDQALSGQHALDLIEAVRADVAFLGAGGAHPTCGLTGFHLDEVATRLAMIRGSAKSYVLADSAKFNRVAPFHVAGWDSLAGLITEAEPPAGLQAALLESGAELIVAG